MDADIWRTYAKYQRSWPLRRCKHEKQPEEANSDEGLPIPITDVQLPVESEGSAPSEPHVLRIHVTIKNFQDCTEDFNSKDGTTCGFTSSSRRQGFTTDRKGVFNGFHGNRAKLSNQAKKSVTNGKDDRTTTGQRSQKSRKSYYTRQKKDSPGKSRSKTVRGKTWLWQNEYDIWHDEQTFDLPGLNRKDSSSRLSASRRQPDSKLQGDLYFQFDNKQLERQRRQAAAVQIQALVRGWMTRYFLKKLREKATDMEMPWFSCIREYLSLISRVRERLYAVRDQPSLDLRIMYAYMEKQQKFDDVFDGMTKLTLPRDSVGAFVKRCGVRVPHREVDDAYNYVFGDIPGIDAAVLVDLSGGKGSDQLNCNQLNMNRTLAEDIGQKFSRLARIGRMVTLTFGEDVDEVRTSIPSENSIAAQHSRSSSVKGGLRCTYKAVRKMRDWFEESQEGVVKIGIIVTNEKSDDSVQTSKEASKAREDNVGMFVIGVGTNIPKEDLKELVSETRIFCLKGPGYWKNRKDDILEEIIQKSRQTQSPTSSEPVELQSLHRADVMEMVWTLHPPRGSGCRRKKKSTWLYKIIDEIEGWDLIDEDLSDHTDLESCIRKVVHSRISRDGSITLPGSSTSDTDRISDIDIAMDKFKHYFEQRH